LENKLHGKDMFMANMQKDLRHAGRIPQETLDYLSNKSSQTFKTEGQEKLRWLTAGITFVVTECLALAIFLGPHHRTYFQLPAITLILLPLLAVPWFSARRTMRRYKLAGDQRIQARLQTDVSYQLASLVFYAYCLFMAGMVTALLK
jgi:hypothetical protein